MNFLKHKLRIKIIVYKNEFIIPKYKWLIITITTLYSHSILYNNLYIFLISIFTNLKQILKKN